MLLNVNPKLDTAMRRLKEDEDFKMFVSWLEESKADLQKSASVTRDEVMVRWIQGSIQVLDDILRR